MSLPKLAALVIFVWLLAWPGLPLRGCANQAVGPHDCCARKQTSCGCESKSEPKLCDCKVHALGEVAYSAPPTPTPTLMAVVLHVFLVLDFHRAQMALGQALPSHRRYQVRGPTEQGLSATQVALPPPA